MPAAKLCVTVTASSMAELRRRRDAVAAADLVELRLDSVHDPDAAGAVEGRRGPVIVTCRAAWEGGHFTGSEDARFRLLSEAMQRGAEYVDVEASARFADDLIAARHGAGVVLSMHDFDGVPADLPTRAGAMAARGAEVTKIAVMARRLADALPLMALTQQAERPMVVIAMGDAGVSSRVLASRFGSAWTYAGEGAAPGQWPARRLLDECAFRAIDEATTVYGVVGRPVMHSLSPAMHNAAFRAAGVNAVYLPLAAADFDDFLQFADALPVAGASVTAPFKVQAFERADDLDPLALRIQSVNTMRRDGARWAACTTDVDGFLAPLETQMALPGSRATVLGAGGAARAVAEALRLRGVQVSISARTPARAHAVAGLTGSDVAPWPPAAGTWDLLVNATPLGTWPDVERTPLPGGPFTGRLVYDLVYNPPETRLLRDARAAGCGALGGLEMLVAQAEAQFAWWTGRQPARGVMRAAALAALGLERAGVVPHEMTDGASDAPQAWDGHEADGIR